MRVKYLQQERRLYTEHLEIKQKSILKYSLPKELPLLKSTQQKGFQTNFAITLKNQYAFVLLHLKKTMLTRNKLSIVIPEVCIFSNYQPYDILYSQNGEIRGSSGKQSVRLRQIYNFFKDKWRLKGLNKDQASVACFQNEQYLMLSDTDLFISCRKFRNDPFFAKLAYIRNKVNAADNPIKVEYDQIKDAEFTGLATQSLLNIQSQSEVLKIQGQNRYLRYCNSKICLFLNYQHNIRVHKANFYYLKNNKNQYVFVNVSNIQYTNLTNAIRQRQKRLKAKEQLRNQCIVMSSQKAERYKRHETSPKVEVIQSQMNQAFQKIASNLRIQTNQQRVRQQQRNEKVFHILYPSLQGNIDVILTQNNFKRLKTDIFKFEERKPLFKSTHTHLKFKSNRSITQTTQLYQNSHSASYAD